MIVEIITVIIPNPAKNISLDKTNPPFTKSMDILSILSNARLMNNSIVKQFNKILKIINHFFIEGFLKF